jgi:addiction module RelE/StbE family toxin
VKVRWSDDAKRDRSDVWNYIAADNPIAAVRLDEQFSQTAHHLGDFPHLGRSSKLAGTREILAHKHYRLIYEIREDAVWIIAVVHTARQWPPVEDEH